MKLKTFLLICLISIYNNISYANNMININNENILSLKDLEEKGNNAYKLGQYKVAIHYYSKYLKINNKNNLIKQKYVQSLKLYKESKNKITPKINIVKILNNNFNVYISPIEKKILEKSSNQLLTLEDYNIRDLDYINLAKASIDNWSKIYPKIKFSFVDNKDYADIIVNWHKSYISVDHWDIISKPKYYEEKDKILSFINIPLIPHQKNKIYDDFKYSFGELSNIIFHLAGHAIGLDENDYLMGKSSNISNYNFSNEKYSVNQNKDFSKQFNINNNMIKKYNYVDMNTDRENDYICFGDKSNINLHSDGKSFLRKYMRWDKKDFPLKVYIPRPSKSYNVDVEYFYSLTLKAFKRWEEKSPDFIKFEFVDTSDNANIVVKWSDYFEHKNYWGLAQSIPYPDNPNRKKLCYIYLAVKAQPGWYSDKPIFFGEQTFINIATHEMGHALGLDHGPDENGATGRGALITDRDINTLKKLYSIPINSEFLCNL